MAALVPTLTAQLARDVYALTKRRTIEEAITDLNLAYGDLFTFADDNLVKGTTGGPGIIKCQTAFGFTVLGKGKLQGHAFMLFRGTQYLADWLTNGNISVSRSNYGNPVHDGFNSTFKSMLPQLTNFMSLIAKSKVHTIHCIGHSLGGALATICTEWVHNAYGTKPYLYTYGSPRVGLIGFSDMCTKRIGSERIFRVYHKTDVVPCIPTWPFIHTPNEGKDYYLPSPGFLVGAEYHGMDHYVNSVSNKDWGSLGLKPERKTDEDIALWLQKDTPVSLTNATLEWLSHGIAYVLNKCVSGASWLVSGACTTSFTLMDQLSYILSTGVNLAENISKWVIFLIRKILRLMGHRDIVEAADLTQTFIRTILLRLQERVNQIARTALSDALVKGRAV